MTVLDLLNSERAAQAARVRAAVVQVRGGGPGGGAGVHLGNGLVATCAHVVRKGEVRIVAANGRLRRARVIAREPAHDLALLEVDATGLPALDLAEDLPQPGAEVLAVGHPWGSVGAVTMGVVLGVGAHPALPDGEWIVTDAHLRPGHSGGPLVDARGRVVGINAVLVVPDLGGAVPASALHRLLAEVVRGEPAAAA